jgi:hypothetical protein
VQGACGDCGNTTSFWTNQRHIELAVRCYRKSSEPSSYSSNPNQNKLSCAARAAAERNARL